MKLYSFKDLSGAFNHPLTGAFIFAGQIGMGQITVTMATEKVIHDIAADGTVMVSYVTGDSGTASIEVQQTSDLHQFLLDCYNLSKIAADAGNPSFVAAAALTVRNLLDGSTHQCTGVSISKIPDKVYAAQGQRLVWNLLCANIQSLNA